MPQTPGKEILSLGLGSLIGAADHHLVNLAGAIDQSRLTGIAVDPLQLGVLALAQGTTELNGGVGG